MFHVHVWWVVPPRVYEVCEWKLLSPILHSENCDSAQWRVDLYATDKRQYCSVSSECVPVPSAQSPRYAVTR